MFSCFFSLEEKKIAFFFPLCKTEAVDKWGYEIPVQTRPPVVWRVAAQSKQKSGSCSKGKLREPRVFSLFALFWAYLFWQVFHLYDFCLLKMVIFGQGPTHCLRLTVLPR